MHAVPVQAETRESGPALTVVDLAKTFRTDWGRRVSALARVSFEVPAGEIFGLLGPNGAGKSTTLKIILGLLRPSRGEGRVLGEPLGTVGVRQRMGFLPENPYFYDYLTAHEFLKTCGALTSVPRKELASRIRNTLERVGLDPGETRRLRKFSKGMLQRIGLAQALLHEPELLILDEPMSGLDPNGRRQVRDLILELKSEGKTVIFASHILSDVESLCDRVGILAHGQLKRTGTVRDLVRSDLSAKTRFEIEVADIPDSLWETWSSRQVARRSGDRILVTAVGKSELEERVRQVLDSGASLLGVKPIASSLEDVFLAVAGGTDTEKPSKSGRIMEKVA